MAGIQLAPSFGPSQKSIEAKLTDGSDLQVRVTTQGGLSEIARLYPTAGNFNRLIDGTSTATVTMILDWGSANNVAGQEAKKIQECENLDDISIGKQELEFRFGDYVFWAGPIQYISWSDGLMTIEAEDNTSWWASRVLPRINIRTAQDLTDIVRLYHLSAMELNQVNGFQIVTSETGQYAETVVEADDKRTASDAIDEIADFGIDYTAVGRKVIIGPPSSFPTLQYEFTDRDFSSALKIEMLGPRQGFATRIIAFGESGDPVTVQADEATISNYGVIERVVEFLQLTNKKDLTLAAQAYLKTFSDPFYISSESGAVLRPGTPIDVASLVAGVKVYVDVSASCREFRGILRIREINYDIAAGAFTLSLEPTSAAFGDTELTEVVQ